MNSLTDLNPNQLRRAANLQEKILSLQRQVQQLLGAPAARAAAAPKKQKRRLSAKGLANIRAALARRWGKRGARRAQAPKRKISAAGRARLSAIAKARWKNVKAAGKSKL